MQISDFLASADAMIDVRVAGKLALLQLLAKKAAGTLNLSAQEILAAFLKREELGSTGMGHGIAIPHARLEGIKKIHGIMVRLKQPIDFDAIDGAPVDLVFMLSLPAASSDHHLRALAAVARMLRVPETLKQLRQARSEREFYAAIF